MTIATPMLAGQDHIDMNIARLQKILEKKAAVPNYEIFEDQSDTDATNRDYDRKLHCVTSSDREHYTSMVYSWGRFLDLDDQAVIVAINIFDKMFTEYRIQPNRDICPYQCLKVKAGKRKTSPCSICTVFKSMVTYDLMICALLLAGDRFFTEEYGYPTQAAAISHMLEFLNPIDVLYDNNNQHKFKELRKISYVQNLKLQIVKFLNNHANEPTPAFEFMNIFTSLLQPYIPAASMERLMYKLAESHKWTKCLKHKHQLLALMLVRSEIRNIDSLSAKETFQLIIDFLMISEGDLDRCEKVYESCKYDAKNKERQNKTQIMDMIKHNMYFSESSRRTKLKFKNNVRLRPDAQDLPKPPIPSDLDETNVRESFVLVLVTGGTLCMVKNESGTYEPLKGYLESAVPHINLLHDDKYFLDHVAERAGKNTFVLPEMKDEMGDTKRVVYTIYEYDPLIDSSNMSYLEYRQLAADIFSVYEHFDGFVIVHGTDTMSYTASSLSFMMEELGKPVVLTGAQKPMAEMRTDAIDNLQGALVIAGTLIIPEVTLYFNRRLFRGNRVMKTDAQDFHAFSSYNMEPLIKMGTEINCNWDLIWRSQKPTKFSISHGWNPNVALLRIFPSITATTVRSFLQPPIRGVVFQSYGAGNGPSNREDIIREIKVAIARGVFIVIISQCQTGIVSSAYAAGAAFAQAGCVLGADMTPEAALAKLSYVLGLEGLTAPQRKELLETNIRGELTQADLTKFSLSNSTFLQSVADSMKVSTEAEIQLIKASLFPCLLCSAAKEGNFESIKKLKEDGGDYSMTDYDGRTPLHIAAAAGHELLVEEMLLDGCPVHKKDHTGCTPLTEAIKNKHFQIIEMLRNAGAVLKCSQQQTCNELMMNVVGNDLDAITAWHAGGADLDAANYDGRTALHIAVARGAEDIVRFLISQGCDPERKDNFGRTPMIEAADQEEIIELLEWGLSMKDPPATET